MRALRSHLINFRKKFTNILPFNYLCKLIFQSYEYIQERIETEIKYASTSSNLTFHSKWLAKTPQTR